MLKSLVLSIIPQFLEDAMLVSFRGSNAHDYGWLMKLYRENGGTSVPRYLIPNFARVNTWSTDMRYSPGTIQEREAKLFLDSAAEIIKWIDRRLS